MTSLGDYEIGSRIGIGATGTVWRAFRRGPVTQVVAVKRLRDTAVDGVAQLRREAMVLTELDHPHIVRVLEVIEDGEGLAICMQFAPGGSLQQMLSQRGRLTPGEVVAVAVPIAEALASAHRRGILHADVKPANILFTSDGEPLLGDFGVARTLGRLTAIIGGQGSIAGTAHYMAPELLEGATPDPRGDIYSLGIVCYEALTGNRPYEAQLPLAVLRAADTGTHERLTDRSDIPPALAEVVERAMAREPHHRFESAEGFAHALRAALPQMEAYLPGTAPPAPPPPPHLRPNAAASLPPPPAAHTLPPPPPPPPSPPPLPPPPAAPAPSTTDAQPPVEEAPADRKQTVEADAPAEVQPTDEAESLAEAQPAEASAPAEAEVSAPPPAETPTPEPPTPPPPRSKEGAPTIPIAADELPMLSGLDVDLPTDREGPPTGPITPPGGTRGFGPRPPKLEPTVPTKRSRGRASLIGAVVAMVLLLGGLAVFIVLNIDGDEKCKVVEEPIAEVGETVLQGDPEGDGCQTYGLWRLSALPDGGEQGMVLTIRVDGERRRVPIGEFGDRILLGDWDCNGTDTPAIYRWEQGELQYFNDWPETDDAEYQPDETESARARGRHRVVQEESEDGETCDAIEITPISGARRRWTTF